MGFNRNGTPGEKGEGAVEDLHQDGGRRGNGPVWGRPDSQGQSRRRGVRRGGRGERGAPVPEPPLGSPLRPGARRQRARGTPRRQVVTIRVALAAPRDASYDILIGGGLLAELPARLKVACPASRYAVITDSHVAKLLGDHVVARFHDATLQAQLFEFPAGEWNKTRETWATLSDRMLAARFGRDSAVVALSGGVVGDLAG